MCKQTANETEVAHTEEIRNEQFISEAKFNVNAKLSEWLHRSKGKGGRAKKIEILNSECCSFLI